MPNTPCLSDKDLLKEFLDAQKQETQDFLARFRQV